MKKCLLFFGFFKDNILILQFLILYQHILKIVMHNLLTDYNIALFKMFYCFLFVHCFCTKMQTCKFGMMQNVSISIKQHLPQSLKIIYLNIFSFYRKPNHFHVTLRGKKVTCLETSFSNKMLCIKFFYIDLVGITS